MAMLDGLLTVFTDRAAAFDSRPRESSVLDLRTTEQDLRVGVLVELAPTEDQYAGLRALGIVIPDDAAPPYIATGYVRAGDIGRLANTAGAGRVEGSRPTSRDCNVVPPTDGLAPGFGLGGRNVVIAVIDSGIDLRHPAFQRDGESQIEAIWDQGLECEPGEQPPASYAYGVEYDANAIQREMTTQNTGARHRDNAIDGCHGTAVASIAAGGSFPGHGSEVLSGVAPQSTLIVVALRQSNPVVGIVDGIRWAIEKSRGRPLVVNLSTGLSGGSHDGAGLFELAVEEAVSLGAVVVKSAGNQADKSQHAEGCADAVGVRLTLSHEDLTTDVFVEFWYDADAPLAFGLSERTGSVVASPSTSAIDLQTPWGGLAVRHSSDGRRRSILIWLQPSRNGSIPKLEWDIDLRSSEGDVIWHAWTGPSRGVRVEPSSRRVTVTAPGNAPSVIVVGAYRDRVTSQSAGISLFSGRGPSRDGRMSIAVVAPGEKVQAALGGTTSSRAMTGTSASAPFVTGVIALMLECCPQLSPTEARRLLMQRASNNGEVAAEGVDTWGAGKLDAPAVLAVLCRESPVSS